MNEFQLTKELEEHKAIYKRNAILKFFAKYSEKEIKSIFDRDLFIDCMRAAGYSRSWCFDVKRYYF